MVDRGGESESDHDYDNDSDSKAGSTGRWTREEHGTFLKGLELHGKGWKKISALIKTRTVVQIRTHAQKYFLKLQKAHQNGGSSENVIMDGKTGNRKRRRRRSDKPISLALPLQPFVAYSTRGVQLVSEGISLLLPTANDEDADNGLYNFLSPPLSALGLGPGPDDDSGGVADDGGNTSSEAGSLGDDATESGGDSGKDASTRSTAAASAGAGVCASANTSDKSSSCDKLRRSTKRSAAHSVTVDPLQPPEWYKRGRAITCLQKDAEGLDWFKDCGAAVVPQDFQPPPSQPHGHGHGHGHQQYLLQQYHGRHCQEMDGHPPSSLAGAAVDMPYPAQDFAAVAIDADTLEMVDFSVQQAAGAHTLWGKAEPSLDIGDAEFDGFFGYEE